MYTARPRLIDRRTLFARSLASALIAGSLHRSVFAGQASPSPVANGDVVANVVFGNTTFAFDLYRQFRDAVDGNIVFSPYSVSLALAMVYAGAKGATAEQMRTALAFSVPSSDVPAAFATLTNDLSARGNDGQGRGEAELRIANAMWGDASFPFATDYLDELASSFDAGFETVDFGADPEGARDQINQWVAEQTNDHIEEIVPEGMIDEMTRLVLANAIYFVGTWRSTFETSDTENDVFHLVDGTTVDVPFMTQNVSLPYHQADNLQIIELPYVADGLAMSIILPDEGQLETIEADLDASGLDELGGGLESTMIDLFLPSFSFDLGQNLNDLLKALGITDAFDSDRADLGGMIAPGADERLAISNVIHDAFIGVDENGTEAAAATVIGIAATSAKPPQEAVTVRVDRPFLFAIRDTETGTILFLGRVMNPADA